MLDIHHGEGYIEISIATKDESRYAHGKHEDRDHEKRNKYKNKEPTNTWIQRMVNQEQSESIIMFEECKRCRSLTLEKKILNSELQEYSFTKFLEQYF